MMCSYSLMMMMIISFHVIQRLSFSFYLQVLTKCDLVDQIDLARRVFRKSQHLPYF